jgi:hypothetical protein
MTGPLLAHLAGDYLIQTDRMASRKTESWGWALAHGATYTLPFLALTRSPKALAVIGGTHVVIDHYRLAKRVIFVKERLTGGLRAAYAADNAGSPTVRDSYDWIDCQTFGFVPTKPDFMAFWLMIIVDNSLHLVINQSALSWGRRGR